MDKFNNMFKRGGVIKYESGGATKTIPVTSDVDEINQSYINNARDWTSN